MDRRLNAQEKLRQANEFAEAVQSMSHDSHREYRNKRITNPGEAVPNYKARLKPLNPKRDGAWMNAHPKLVLRDENGELAADTAQLDFEDLWPSQQDEAQGSLKVAYAEVQEFAEDGMMLDDSAVEEIATKVHIEWLKRNFPKISRDEVKRFRLRLKELKNIRKSGGLSEEVRENFERRDRQFLEYENPNFQPEREYDRESVHRSLREFRKRHPEAAKAIYVPGDFVSVSPGALDTHTADPAFAELLNGGVFEVISVKQDELLLRAPNGKAGGLIVKMSEVSLSQPHEPSK